MHVLSWPLVSQPESTLLTPTRRLSPLTPHIRSMRTRRGVTRPAQIIRGMHETDRDCGENAHQVAGRSDETTKSASAPKVKRIAFSQHCMEQCMVIEDTFDFGLRRYACALDRSHCICAATSAPSVARTSSCSWSIRSSATCAAAAAVVIFFAAAVLLNISGLLFAIQPRI
jgi:hypothetical protein